MCIDGMEHFSSAMPITAQEFTKIEDIVLQSVEPVKLDVATIKEGLASLVGHVDQFLRIVRNHDQEWLIVRAQHQKMREALVQKGIVTEEDLSIT